MKEPQPYTFSRIAGALCLDFVNTASWVADQRSTEHLNDFGDLVRWCTESAIVPHGSATVFCGEAEQGATILAEAKETRETLYRIFIALSRDQAPAGEDLQPLNETLARAPLRFEVHRQEKGFACERKAGATEFAMLLGPVVWSAAELLTSGQCQQVKCCASDSCGWLFLDNTKNHSRRWCDMGDCGSRAKSKRYYRKKLSVSVPVEEERVS